MIKASSSECRVHSLKEGMWMSEVSTMFCYKNNEITAKINMLKDRSKIYLWS